VFNESNQSNEEVPFLDDDDASYYSTDDDSIENGHPLGVRNSNRLVGAIPEPEIEVSDSEDGEDDYSVRSELSHVEKVIDSEDEESSDSDSDDENEDTRRDREGTRREGSNSSDCNSSVIEESNTDNIGQLYYTEDLPQVTIL